MIFVTVGTHEQPFNRLIEEIDKLKENNVIQDDIIIQRGYSTYLPKNCQCYDFLQYDKMEQIQKEAKLIITHGGPSSFIYPISIGKIPIVVPRQKKYAEHINDHQLIFCQELVKRNFPIVCIENINELKNIILNYKYDVSVDFKSNNEKFITNFNKYVKDLF